MGHLEDGKGWNSNDHTAMILYWFLALGYARMDHEVQRLMITHSLKRGPRLSEWYNNPGSVRPTYADEQE